MALSHGLERICGGQEAVVSDRLCQPCCYKPWLRKPRCMPGCMVLHQI